MKKETFLIRNQIDRTKFREHSAPIYFSSSYVFDDAEHMRALFADEQDGYIYSRYSNPNVDEFCSKMAYLELTEAAWATASGMAAVYTTFAALLKAGDEIVSCSSIFGSTHRLFTEILPKFNINTRYGAFDKVHEWEQLITSATKMVYIESPTNPGLDLVDIEAVSHLCKKHGLLLVVDNCFATPLVQQPAKFGADIIIHSATKYIDGQGRAMGGVICASNELIKKIEAFARHTGPSLSPFNAWVLSKSLETLSVRMERHVNNANELALRLSEHESVKMVKYPFLNTHPQYQLAQKQMYSGGGLIAFELKKGLNQGKAFLNNLKMISLTANLGDVRTIATHPASTTHSKLTEEERLNVGITPGLVRISVGLEHIDDIWADVKQALDNAV
jgi:O-succinylhomoserine sulfhydrylase